MDRLRLMPTPSAQDLHQAATDYFHSLMADFDQRSSFEDEHFDDDVAINVEASKSRMAELDHQLRNNAFDAKVTTRADRLARRVGSSLAELDDLSRSRLLQLVALAQHDLMRRVIHVLATPAVPFQPAFLPAINFAEQLSGTPHLSNAPPQHLQPSRTLRWCVDEYEKRLVMRMLKSSHKTETTRALRFLTECFGADAQIHALTPSMMAGFCEGLEKLDKRLRSKPVPFNERQTDDPEFQLNPRTSQRYWNATAAFFGWCQPIHLGGQNPTLGIKPVGRLGVPVKSPEAFSQEEVRRLLCSPLYAGHRSETAISVPGNMLSKGSKYWSGLIALYTGMRAGEIAQLQVDDLDLDAAIPIFRVRLEGAEGAPAKMLKTTASAREIPIAQVLIDLGLGEFVKMRAKGVGAPRIFPDISLGQKDRRSDGLSKFWGPYLRKVGLHKPGRATHVFRYTFSAALARAEIDEATISRVVGHVAATQTQHYTGLPLNIHADAIAKVDYGLNIVVLLREHELKLAGPAGQSQIVGAKAGG